MRQYAALGSLMLAVIASLNLQLCYAEDVKIGLVGDVGTLDPIFSLASENSYQVSTMMFRGLVNFDANDELYHDMADTTKDSVNHQTGEWEITAELKECARWSDGVPVTAHDVEFTVNVLKNPLTATSTGKPNPWYRRLSHLRDMRIVSETKIVLVFKKRVHDYRGYLKFGLLPKHILNPGNKDSCFFKEGSADLLNLFIGNGPYCIASPGGYLGSRSFLMVRNPHYSCSAPHLDSFHINIYNDASAMANQLMMSSGIALDYVQEIPISQINKFKAVQGVKLFPYMEHSFKAIVLNGCNGPFGNRDLRRAIALAIDREAIVHNVYSDHAEFVNGPYMPGSPYGKGLLTGVEFDPATAESILDSLGIVDIDGDGMREFHGIHTELKLIYYRDLADDRKMQQIIVRNLDDIGLKVRAVSLQKSDFGNDLENHQFDLAILMPKQTSGPDVSVFYHTNEYFNYGCYSNLEVDNLLELIIDENDEERVRNLTAQLDQYLSKEFPMIFLLYREFHGGAVRNLMGYPTSGFNLLDRTEEWYLE